MKKSYIFLATTAFIAIVVMPAVIKAQIDETATRTPLRAVPAMIRQELRSDIQERQTNARTNQNMRNNLLQNRASSTRPFSGKSNPLAGKTMLVNAFEMRKHNISSELQKAVDNLTNISNRLQSSIDKAVSNGRDMTGAKALLVIANSKIVTAQNAVNSILNLTATSSVPTTASSSVTTTVDLNKPRLIASAAQQAIKDAQKALNNVIAELLKSSVVK